MAGRLALVGGDEFRPGCEDMDSALLEATGVANPQVVVIPTAAIEGSPAKAASNGVEHFSKLGADTSSVMVITPSDANNETLVSPVEFAHVIYISGGNPAYLLETIKDSLLLEKIMDNLNRGAILAGSSAGAMVMGSWMRFREWREALGIASGIVTFPHHERSEPESAAKEIRASAPDRMTVFGVDGKTGCLSGPDGWTVLGSGKVTVYKGDGWERYTHGDVFTLS